MLTEVQFYIYCKAVAFMQIHVFLYVVCVSHLEFHVSIGRLRAELHLFLELLQCHICLLNLLPLALPGSVQLALHLSTE